MKLVAAQLVKQAEDLNASIKTALSIGLVVNTELDSDAIHITVSERGYTSKVLATNEPALRASHKR